ncbi:MAG TPA: class I SAM-dependent methyltransferase [Trebonia sp.]|jgi:SAM-dependent methyltransferase|nr:class I SAM-dependent methyltransferase [Trebonia sp.]
MGASLSHHTGSNVPPGAATARLAAGTEQRLRAATGLLLPLDEELALLAGLQEFELGRFLLHNAGLNGYWTSYVFRYQPGDPTATALEHWLLNRSLLAGIRERFQRFRALIAREAASGAVLASVPCGVMDDLLSQDYADVAGLRLIGVDIDAESVDLAAKNAARRGMSEHCQFLVRDAWQLGLDSEADLLVSNGLNMYEPDRDRLVGLYRNFRQALRPGGKLLVSFIPAPPPPPWAQPAHAAAWARYGIGEADLRRDMAVFGDILQPRYLNFTSEQEFRAQAAEAGLVVTGISRNAGGALPIATAVRPR